MGVAAEASDRAATAHVIHVRIDGRYEPERIVVPAGVPLRLVFHRAAGDVCGGRVLFPLQGEEVDVPASGTGAIDLAPAEAGEYDFRCGPGELHGTLVVEDLKTGTGAPESPWAGVAVVLLSFVLPGLGHMMVRAWTRGLIWLAGWILLTATSGGAAHPLVLVLMVATAIDAVVYLRLSRSERG